jgi:Chaperone of endosialidase
MAPQSFLTGTTLTTTNVCTTNITAQSAVFYNCSIMNEFEYSASTMKSHIEELTGKILIMDNGELINLSSQQANFSTMTSDSLNVTYNLEAVTATLKYLSGISASYGLITGLNASVDSCSITSLRVNTAELQTLTVPTLYNTTLETSESIRAQSISVSTAVIDSCTVNDTLNVGSRLNVSDAFLKGLNASSVVLDTCTILSSIVMPDTFSIPSCNAETFNASHIYSDSLTSAAVYSNETFIVTLNAIQASLINCSVTVLEASEKISTPWMYVSDTVDTLNINCGSQASFTDCTVLSSLNVCTTMSVAECFLDKCNASTLNSDNLVTLNASVNASLYANDATFANFISVGYSDERLKDIVEYADDKNYLDRLCELNVFKYVPKDWASEQYGLKKEVRYGLSAQQVQNAFPETVKPALFAPGYLTLDYNDIVPILVQSVKELNKRVTQLSLV